MKNKVLVLGLVFSFLACSANLAAKERRGADLVITKSDGQEIKGELIAVKPSALLLLDSQTGADVSVEIGKVAVIKIIKKSKVWTIGAVGLGAGAIFGLFTVGGLERLLETEPTTSEAITWVGFWGAVCAVPGMLIGAFLGTDRTIQIEGKSQEEIKASMEKLRAQARITNFQ